MEIFAKIGTGPGGYIRVKGKRKLPEVGEHIKFKRVPIQAGVKWEGGYVDEIVEVSRHGDKMWMISRF